MLQHNISNILFKLWNSEASTVYFCLEDCRESVQFFSIDTACTANIFPDLYEKIESLWNLTDRCTAADYQDACSNDDCVINFSDGSHLLYFPTKEMRDKFYQYFLKK